MLDNGYALTHIEIFNWGNFQGLHKIPIRTQNDWGPLFQVSPAVAVLGLNGSGKSTLIDGLMMLLLPFENQLRLGVTNDYEKGDTGGRTIRDYVLGKYASVGGSQEVDPEQIFNRKDGCTIFLSVFKHNGNPDRMITLARVWWYQSYKVSENSACLLSYEDLNIEKLCQEGKTPKNLKTLKETLVQSAPSSQIFDTISSYFQSLSTAFGHLQKDDLKILNRAFYVKSISQIDQFIRENMLIENESPHLDRLLENVRNAKDISTSIQICQQKMNLIEKVLKELRRLSEHYNQKKQIEFDIRVAEVFKDWRYVQNLKKDLFQLQKLTSDLEIELPKIQILLNSKQTDFQNLKNRIESDDIKIQIQLLEKELENFENKALEVQKKQNFFNKNLSMVSLTLPKSPKDFLSFEEKIRNTLTAYESEQSSNEELFLKYQTEKVLLNEQVQELRSELDHVSKFKTLIPFDLYEIKNQACEELKIPKSHLLFVGEIVQIKTHLQKYRRAIESVLFPISRNLLCHPDHLVALTKWLDNKGLRHDITVKRISNEELLVDVQSPKAFNESQILGMVDVKNKKENPFFAYLWTWLLQVFDYSIVNVNNFKNSEITKLVTEGGLVKTDTRTMRKLKSNFSYSLGWDNQDIIDTLAQKLVVHQKRFTELMALIEKYSATREPLYQKLSFLKNLDLNELKEVLLIPELQNQIQNIKKQKQDLFIKNPDYKKLEETLLELNVELESLQRKFYSTEALLKSNLQKIENLNSVLPEEIQKISLSYAYSLLFKEFQLETLIEERLVILEKKLNSKKLEFSSYLTKLESEKTAFDEACQMDLAQLNQTLQLAKIEIQDANLSYTWKSYDQLKEFTDLWRSAFERLASTELPAAQEKWKQFFNQVLLDSIRDMINEFKTQIHEIKSNIDSINGVLKLTNYEELPNENRYLRIDYQSSLDDRIRSFKKQVSEIEKILGPMIRSQIETQSIEVMQVLEKFVENLQRDAKERIYVTDVRNHFTFQVASHRRISEGEGPIVEIFTGAKKDAKSSAQTTQLAYTLLASCLSYRFHFNDPVRGRDTLRLLILDEFGGKFDNEKPKEIIKLLDQMGFQSLLVSPMAKADLLAAAVSQMVFIYKISASQSKVDSIAISKKEDYYNLMKLKVVQLENKNQSTREALN